MFTAVPMPVHLGYLSPKRVLGLVAALLFTLSLEVHAQAIPTPPTASQIFASGVEILSESLTSLPTPLPTLGSSESFPSIIFQQPTLAVADLPPAPEGYAWGVLSGGTPLSPTESPDARSWIALAYTVGEEQPSVHALAYNRQTNVFRDLGGIVIGETNLWGEWYENSIVLLQTITWGMRYSYGSLYVLDLNTGVMEIGPIHHPSQLLDSDPPELKVLWMTGELGDSLTCHLTVYDVVQKSVIDHPYGPYCFVEFQSNIGKNYYRAVTNDQKQATVAYFNAEIGDHTDLYTGEVEHVFWVSADEHFAVIALDSSGMIDVMPSDGARSDRYTQAQLSAVDLRTGQVLYQMPVYWENAAGFWSADVFEIRDNWLWVNTVNDPSLGPNRFLHLVDDRVEINLLDATLSTDIGGGWFIIGPSERQAHQWVKLYNMETAQIVEVADVSNFQQYTIGINTLQGNEFEVIVQCCLAGDTFNHSYEARYRVRVPQIAIPSTS
ncbi:MAG: hypothetical protein K8L97_20530 [Anaerolineae bacterium]|nr:hypothetical protein [Anaerolineae bacterium]